MFFTLQFRVLIPPPSDSPRPPRSEPPSPPTGCSPPPLLPCPQMPAPPPTPTSRPAAVCVRSSRAVGATLRSALFSKAPRYLETPRSPVFRPPFTFPLLVAGVGPLSHPESSGPSDEGPRVHPAEAQVPAGGDSRLWPNQSSAPDLLSGSGQARVGPWSRRRERRRRRRGEGWGQQSEQQSPPLSSGPGLPSGC